jgi:RNA recognition motif-containing protein
MSRGHHSSNKRQRESDRARKKEEKAQRRSERRAAGPQELEVVSASAFLDGMPSSEEAMRAMEQRNSEPRSASTIPARLFVGGLSDDATDADLREMFGEIGAVAEAVVVVDRATRTPRGFGFVTMQDRRDAPKAIEALDGSELRGRRIAVKVATERARY